MSLHSASVMWRGMSATNTGLAGSLMSMNDVPFARPMMTHSLPVVGSVQPHESLPGPPNPLLGPPPNSSGGKNAFRSIPLHGNGPANPFTHGSSKMGSSGISSGGSGTCAPATVAGKNAPINNNVAAIDVSATLRRARKGFLILHPPSVYG